MSRIVGIVIILFFITGCAVDALADEAKLPINIGGETGIYSDYIWRGFVLDDDPVMQSGANVSLYGLKASVWGSFDIHDSDDTDGDELDLTLDYTYKYKLLTLSAGNTWYRLTGTDGESIEFYIGSGLDVPGSPALTWYHDYGDEDDGGGRGDYFLLSAAHSFPLFKLRENDMTFDVNGHIGYNHRLFIEGDGGDFAIGAGFTVPLNKYVSLVPSASYSVPFGDLRSADDGAQEDKFYFGGKVVFAY